MFANRITDPYGRKVAVQLNAVAVALGSLLVATASSVFMLTIGRFVKTVHISFSPDDRIDFSSV